MSTKERYQNPVINDTLNLRLFTYNSNNPADVNLIQQVQTYYLDPTFKSEENPEGRRLVDTFAGSAVAHECTGIYLLPVFLESPKYVIGKYLDVWTIQVVDDEPISETTNDFEIYPQLWYTNPIPTVFDFKFHFQPNKLRFGAKQFLIIEVNPNVPRATDLTRYYLNLAIAAEMRVTIEQRCGDCLPVEKDLRTIIDDQLVDYRDKRFGYIQIDTCGLDMKCGIYDVTVKLCLGGNNYISDRMPLQIYD